MSPKLALLLLLSKALIAQSAFICPATHGLYEDEKQCDKYYECIQGVPETKLCSDGLVFDPESSKIEPCDHPFNVDCGTRTLLQPPDPSGVCPRRNGFFPHPDPTVCNVFYTCIEGKATKMTCTTGLYFDPLGGNCVWPDTSGRVGCQIKRETVDGFTCPSEPVVDAHGQTIPHPKFPHPTNCRKFFVCLSGTTPRENGCFEGEVYNAAKEMCDYPEEVPECEDWYKDSPPARRR